MAAASAAEEEGKGLVEWSRRRGGERRGGVKQAACRPWEEEEEARSGRVCLYFFGFGGNLDGNAVSFAAFLSVSFAFLSFEFDLVFVPSS